MSDTQIIIELLHTQDEKRELQIKGIQKNMDAGFDTLAGDMNKMVKADEKRNGKIERMEKETVVVRWFQRNPGKTVIIAALFGLALFFTFHMIDFEKTLKAKGIELKDG